MTTINRVLWLLVAIALLATVVGRLWLSTTAKLPQSAPPPVVLAPHPARIPMPAEPALPARNPFAADGQIWVAAGPAPRATGNDTRRAPPRVDSIRGMLRFSDFAGVLTTTGFVPQGGRVQGAVVQAVSEEGVTLGLDGGETLVVPPAPSGRKGSAALAESIRIRPVQ